MLNRFRTLFSLLALAVLVFQTPEPGAAYAQGRTKKGAKPAAKSKAGAKKGAAKAEGDEEAAAEGEEGEESEEGGEPVAAAAPAGGGGGKNTPGASSLSGSTGLIRVLSAEPRTPWTIRIGAFGEYAKASDFLVAGDENSRVIGDFVLSITTIELVEVYTSLSTLTNENNKNPSQPLLMDLSDLAAGIKTTYRVKPFFSTGLDLAFDFNANPGETTVSFGSTGVYIKALTSLDVRQLVKSIPLIFHTNLGGYIISGDAYNGINYNAIQQFGLNIYQKSQFIAAFGLEAPLPWVTPFADIHISTPDGLSVVTPGLRAQPIQTQAMYLTLALELGIRRTIPELVPATPPWNFVFGINYAFGTSGGGISTGGGGGGAPVGGTLDGLVLSAADGKPLEDVVVSFGEAGLPPLATGPDGRFVSGIIPDGEYELTFRREGYGEERKAVSVAEGQLRSVKVRLAEGEEKAEAKPSRLTGFVAGKDGKPIAASIALSGAESKSAAADGTTGNFALDLKPGVYDLDITAKDHKPVKQKVAVEAGTTAVVNVQLASAEAEKPAGAQSQLTIGRAALNWGRIAVAGPIGFMAGDAAVDAGSRAVLEDIAALLKANPTIKKVAIEAHTDNQGTPEELEAKADLRANTVKNALTKLGVPPNMLETRAMGDISPVANNRTAAGRAQNNRIEFVVTETDTSKGQGG